LNRGKGEPSNRIFPINRGWTFLPSVPAGGHDPVFDDDRSAPKERLLDDLDEIPLAVTNDPPQALVVFGFGRAKHTSRLAGGELLK